MNVARRLPSALLLSRLFEFAASIDNGLALRPYMGYNTWYDFECSHINASNVMRLADAMVARGLDKLGYSYLNIDDCWATKRDPATHVVQADPAAFPQGMKAVADYVHSRGLKFGIYTDRGTATCAGRPGSLGYEDLDARTYAAWGVDLVKEDSCNANASHEAAFEEYARMRDALNRTGRPMVFNLCGWSSWYAPAGRSLGNSWRVAGDGSNWGQVVNNALTNAELAAYAGPGGWNDPDFLLGSSPEAAARLTPLQSRMQFSLWAVMAAPLIISCNLLHISAFDLETYTNSEVIAVDQDALGVQGTAVWSNCPKVSAPSPRRDGRSRGGSAHGPRAAAAAPACQQIWARPLADGGHALAFVNFAPSPASASCGEACFEALGFRGGARPARVRDLWRRAELGPAGGELRLPLEASGGFALLRLEGRAVGPAARAAGERAEAAAPVVV